MTTPSNLGENLLNGRDLAAARDAYQQGDAEASKTAHTAGIAPESHQSGGDRVKTIVFGGLDGILTAHAVIAAAVGAKLLPSHVLALGISNVLADALSMGVGEYLSARSYTKYVHQELRREEWELDNFPEGEVSEMIELYEAKGMSREDATEVITRLAKYREIFLEAMMKDELDLPMPDEADHANSVRSALTMFASFAVFGMVPVFGFALVPLVWRDSSDEQLFLVACCITAVALATLGSIKARFTDHSYLRSGVETVVLGGACAAVAFFVGGAVASYLE